MIIDLITLICCLFCTVFHWQLIVFSGLFNSFTKLEPKRRKFWLNLCTIFRLENVGVKNGKLWLSRWSNHTSSVELLLGWNIVVLLIFFSWMLCFSRLKSENFLILIRFHLFVVYWQCLSLVIDCFQRGTELFHKTQTSSKKEILLNTFV